VALPRRYVDAPRLPCHNLYPRSPRRSDMCATTDMLNKVSRSFAIVIQQLPRELQAGADTRSHFIAQLEHVHGILVTQHRAEHHPTRAATDGWQGDAVYGETLAVFLHSARCPVHMVGGLALTIQVSGLQPQLPQL